MIFIRIIIIAKKDHGSGNWKYFLRFVANHQE